MCGQDVWQWFYMAGVGRIDRFALCVAIAPTNPILWQALVEDPSTALRTGFRKANWVELVPYPELVFQQSQKFLQA